MLCFLFISDGLHTLNTNFLYPHLHIRKGQRGHKMSFLDTKAHIVKCNKCDEERQSYNDPRTSQSVIECKKCFESHRLWTWVRTVEGDAAKTTSSPSAPPQQQQNQQAAITNPLAAPIHNDNTAASSNNNANTSAATDGRPQPKRNAWGEEDSGNAPKTKSGVQQQPANAQPRQVDEKTKAEDNTTVRQKTGGCGCVIS